MASACFEFIFSDNRYFVVFDSADCTESKIIHSIRRSESIRIDFPITTECSVQLYNERQHGERQISRLRKDCHATKTVKHETFSCVQKMPRSLRILRATRISRLCFLAYCCRKL